MKRILPALVLSVITTSCFGGPFFESDNPNIHYSGRVDFTDPKKPAFDWPGIYITTLFEGPELTLYFEDEGTRYDIYIDKKFHSTITTRKGVTEYPITENLTENLHHLKIGKRTESHETHSIFLGLKLKPGKQLKKPAAPVRRIEFIGDSLMAAYGCESPGRTGNKEDYIRYTNTNKSFCVLTASVFDAEYHINAISGKGLVRNSAGREAGFEYPRYYEKTLITRVYKEEEPLLWDFSTWKPDIVVIGLGTNDFAGNEVPPPSFETFQRAYFQLLEKIRDNYGDVTIIALALPVWPHLTFRGYMKDIVKKAQNRGFNILYHEYKVDMLALHWHPSLDEHRAIADGLIKKIEQSTPFSTSRHR